MDLDQIIQGSRNRNSINIENGKNKNLIQKNKDKVKNNTIN